MNFGDLQALTSDWLDDVKNGYFTLPIVKLWINNAQKEVQKLLLNAAEDYYTVCVETDTVIGQARYGYPDRFMKVQGFEAISSGSGDTAETETISPIVRIEGSLIVNVQGDSFNYILNKDTFTLKPAPKSVKTLRMEYSRLVADMVDLADVPDVPAQYHEYMAILAARDGFLKDRRSLAPIESKLIYYEGMLKKDVEQRRQDQPRTVVASDAGYGEY